MLAILFQIFINAVILWLITHLLGADAVAGVGN